MRFTDFFIEYKLRILSISPYIKIKDMSKFKLVGMIISMVCMAVGVGMIFFENLIALPFYLVSFVSIFVTWAFSERRSEKEKMLNQHYKPYSKKRMRAFLNLLEDYGINHKDEKKLNMLIEQAEMAKKNTCIFKDIKSPISTVMTYIVIPVMLSVFKKLIDIMELDAFLTQMLYVGLIAFLLVGLWLGMSSIVKTLLGGEMSKYEDLKYDLQQIMIFGDSVASRISEN